MGLSLPDRRRPARPAVLLKAAGALVTASACLAAVPQHASADTAALPAVRDVVAELAAGPLTQLVRTRLADGVTYFVIPHPDDEVSSLALAQEADKAVFVFMTRGGATVFCNQASHGGAHTDKCKEDRDASSDQFLDRFRTVGPVVHKDGYDLATGPTSARLRFDFPDGALTTAQVTKAIEIARQVGRKMGPEQYVVASAEQYGNRDHTAVHDAVKAYGGLWKILVNSPGAEDNNIAVDVTGAANFFARGGLMDQCFGWLTSDSWSNPLTSGGLHLGRGQEFQLVPKALS